MIFKKTRLVLQVVEVQHVPRWLFVYPMTPEAVVQPHVPHWSSGVPSRAGVCPLLVPVILLPALTAARVTTYPLVH